MPFGSELSVFPLPQGIKENPAFLRGACFEEAPAELSQDSLESVAFQALAFQLARTANGFGLFTSLFLGGLFKVAAQFHFAKDTFALHFFLQSLQSLIDVVVANDNLYHFKDHSFHKRGGKQRPK